VRLRRRRLQLRAEGMAKCQRAGCHEMLLNWADRRRRSRDSSCSTKPQNDDMRARSETASTTSTIRRCRTPLVWLRGLRELDAAAMMSVSCVPQKGAAATVSAHGVRYNSTLWSRTESHLRAGSFSLVSHRGLSTEQD